MRHSTLFVQEYFCNRIYRGSLNIYFCTNGNVSYIKRSFDDHFSPQVHYMALHCSIFFLSQRYHNTRWGVVILDCSFMFAIFFLVLFPSSILMYHALCNTYYTLVLANYYTIYMVWLISRFGSTYYLYNMDFTVYITLSLTPRNDSGTIFLCQ